MKRLFITFIYLFILLSGNNYATATTANDILVYDPGSGDIQKALIKLGLSYDLRDQYYQVTLDDLRSHSVLVVGWASPDGNYDGIASSDIEAGITGNILLTGHDPDFHFSKGYYDNEGKFDAVKTEKIGLFLRQAIEFGKSRTGAGLIAFGDYWGEFPFLPSSYGISATGIDAEAVKDITPYGMANHVYDGLSAGDMSGWINSYHAEFLEWDQSFKAFEMGPPIVGFSANPSVTIARTVPEPSTIFLLCLSLIGVAVTRKKIPAKNQYKSNDSVTNQCLTGRVPDENVSKRNEFSRVYTRD